MIKRSLKQTPSSMELIVFFAIGALINIIVLVLFVRWFRREWRRTGKPR